MRACSPADRTLFLSPPVIIIIQFWRVQSVLSLMVYYEHCYTLRVSATDRERDLITIKERESADTFISRNFKWMLKETTKTTERKKFFASSGLDFEVLLVVVNVRV